MTVKKEQKPAKLCFLNDAQIEVIKVTVDGCLNLQGKRCDYLIKIDNPTIEIYVELKGCRVKDGIEQIENTIKQIPRSQQKTVRYCYIIHTRCPQSTDIQNMMKRFKKEYNAHLLIKKSGFTAPLQNLLSANKK